MRLPYPRHVLMVALVAVALAACGNKNGGAVTSDDMSMGPANAKVTVVEYASVACPFCANFNNTVFPAFKAKYIDTGKIHYVFREMLVGNDAEVTTAAAGFLLARCAGREKYFTVVDTIFHDQEQMAQSGDVRGTLLRIAQSTGMNEQQFNTCINDEQALKALNDRVQTYSTRDNIESTPTFVINGKKMDGAATLANLDAAIAAAQAK
ncbi:MAG TPA: thioredoxin domain-containing protein [Caulobacteraceae bacterium]|nr:thioredoxin domain-containing protein [Caulobacteraceae bacterium]